MTDITGYSKMLGVGSGEDRILRRLVGDIESALVRLGLLVSRVMKKRGDSEK